MSTYPSLAQQFKFYADAIPNTHRYKALFVSRWMSEKDPKGLGRMEKPYIFFNFTDGSKAIIDLDHKTVEITQ